MKGVRLFRVLGVQISANYTWFIVFGLIAWSLASSYFPLHYPGLSRSSHWVMGFLGAVFLFLSVLIHEITHSTIAKREGIEVKEITLFIFGGVSQLTKEPEDPLKELKVAIGGPLSSLVLAFLFWIASEITSHAPDFILYTGLLSYLAFINLSLAVFNLIPGFPLDGGRVLRAIYWKRTGSLRRATRIATEAGKWFGVGIILIGLSELLVKLMQAAQPILSSHPVKQKRIAAGRRPGNAIWLWGQGPAPSMPSFSADIAPIFEQNCR